MIKPSIHLNGTCATELARQYENVAISLSAALEALHAAAPNARDYYPQSDGATRQAFREHVERVQKLQDMHAEMMALFHYAREGSVRKESR